MIRRRSSHCFLPLVLLLFVSPSLAADPPARAHFTEDFSADPALDADWELAGAWSWDGDLFLTPPSGDCSAVWRGEMFAAGVLGMRLMLLATGEAVRPSVELTLERHDYGLYSVRLLAADGEEPGRVTVSRWLPDEQVLASAVAHVPVDAWLDLRVAVTPRGRARVLLGGREVLRTPPEGDLASAGCAGLRTSGSAVAVDHFWFRHGCTIRGHLRTKEGNGVPNVVVSAFGPHDFHHHVHTDARGGYILAVPQNWTGRLEVAYLGFDVHPHRRRFSGVRRPVADIDFTFRMTNQSCPMCHSANTFGGLPGLAPNVMGDGIQPFGDGSHPTPRPYDDGSWGFSVNGHGRDIDTFDRSRGGAIGATCMDDPATPGVLEGCHDLGQSAGTHLDGVVQGKGNATANTYHLVSGFINTDPVNPWSVQVRFDDYCYSACHHTRTIDMRHARDTIPAPGVMLLGSHNTYPDGDLIPLPIDDCLTTLALPEEPDFAPCIACHDPHGTATISPRADGNNKMARHRWSSTAVLCEQCHF